MRKRYVFRPENNRPLVTEDGFIDRASLLALYEEIRENARLRGAWLTDDEAWGMAWSAASEIWLQMYQDKERVG